MKTVLLLSFICMLSSNCTVYKSEGKKSFESATTEYGDRATASGSTNPTEWDSTNPADLDNSTPGDFKDCEVISADDAELLLNQNENGGIESNIIFSEKNQSYYSCPDQY